MKCISLGGALVIAIFGLVMASPSKAQGVWSPGSYAVDPGSVTITLDPPDDEEEASATTSTSSPGVEAMSSGSSASAEITATLSRTFTWTPFFNGPVPANATITVSGTLTGSATGTGSTATSDYNTGALDLWDAAPPVYNDPQADQVFTFATGGVGSVAMHVQCHAKTEKYGDATARIGITM
ncbi:MAG TPA: hypothetical protein VKT77_12130 [Chthonomonadaceae bacterium]|nr:hypothetical protein [Chthonomonadaceae bacterium]